MSSKVANFKELGATVTVVLAAMLSARNAGANTGRLLVFLHVAVKPRALQSALEAALPGIEVIAVGRVSDFERFLKEGVDAIIALPVVLAAFKLSAQLHGNRAGSQVERYSLVAVDGIPEPRRVATVGALDLLGRDGTNAFVKDLLEANPRVERVSKVEDLLRLLQAQVADAILLPSRLFSEIRATSKLNLSPFELPKPVGLPSAVGTSAEGPQVLAALSRMPAQVARTLGVDSWR